MPSKKRRPEENIGKLREAGSSPPSGGRDKPEHTSHLAKIMRPDAVERSSRPPYLAFLLAR